MEFWQTEMADNLHIQCKESDLWLLIQYERPQTVHNYAIIHSSEVVQKDKMRTGKTIHFRFGNMVLKAVIFIISDDKMFLETEMMNLNKVPTDDRNQEPVEMYKRRRHMSQSPIEYKPNSSIFRLPSPAWSNDTNESINSNLKNQIIAPPMTFDQGTQTDFELSAVEGGLISNDPSKITQQLETLLIENQQLRKENQETKKLVNELASHTYDVETMMKDIHKKLELNERAPQIINTQMKTKSSNQIVNMTHAEIDNESSNISYSNCSCLSGASNEPIYNPTTMASHQSVVNDIKENWNVIKIDELSDEIVIGSNGTRIHRSVLDTIKWASYSYATRKLLSALFTREVLATHSLTGKPSPGYSKPAKNQLKPLIIADIVQFVSQRCNVSCADVRIAITTKCGDESRVYRKQMENKRSVLHAMDNKENAVEQKIHNSFL